MMSTTFHPQTDGQSERTIDELKSHLFLVHFSVCFSFKNK